MSKQKKTAQAVAQVKPKLSYREKTVLDLQGVFKRLTRLAKKLDKLPPEMMLSVTTSDTQAYGMKVVEGVAAIALAFDGLAEQVARLPDDWKPARAKRGRPGLAVNVGDAVQIREKSAAKYADLFPAGTYLTVADVKMSLVGVKQPSGEVVYRSAGSRIGWDPSISSTRTRSRQPSGS
jgi:hypothetical protein